jgi:Tol biopolymer transport system component
MKVVGAGDPIPLTSGAAAEYGPAWSFDGRLIAFLRQSEPTTVGLYVMAPLGGVERKVADAAAPAPIVLRRFMRRLAWTADSSHVIVSVPNRAGGGEGLLSVSVADGEKFWLTEPKAGMYTGDREPAVSPDGTCVAFARGELAASEVLNLLRLTSDLRPAGAPEPLSAAGRARSPAWSPDGSEILYTEVNPGMAAGSGISRIRIEKVTAPVPITALGPTVGVPAVARTGRVAYSRINIQSSIWRQELPTRGAECPVPTRLTSTAASDMNAQYSPDGHRIAFASNRSGSREIWTCNSDGAHCQAVTAFRGNYATGTPRWSPDGRQIAFDSGAAGDLDVYVIDANGGAPKRLTDDRTRGIIPNWSSDGKWIYFSSSRTGANEIWKISLAGGVAVPVTRSGGVNATESPDGKALYYSKSDGRGDLYRSQTDGSGEHLVLRGAAKRGFVVAEDRIYYLLEQTMHSATIRVLLLRNGADLHVARVSEPLFGGLSLSPDGRYLIYSQVRTAANLMLAEGVFRQR